MNTALNTPLVRPLHGLAERGLVWRLATVFLCAIAIALSARVNVPMFPVPMSMQTFTVLLIAAMSGRNLAVQTLIAYLAMGAAGAPMFVGGAGPAYMMGTTGGYLAGFLAAAFLVGTLADRGWNLSALKLTASVLLGHLVIFALGAGWLTYAFMGGDIAKAVAAGVTPFLLGMVAKTALVVATVEATRRATK